MNNQLPTSLRIRGVVGRRRGGTAFPHFFRQGGRVHPLFFTEIHAKVSPMLQLVTY